MSGLNVAIRSTAHATRPYCIAGVRRAAPGWRVHAALGDRRPNLLRTALAVGPARVLVSQSPLRRAKFGPYGTRSHRPAARSRAAFSKLFRNRSIPQGRHEGRITSKFSFSGLLLDHLNFLKISWRELIFAMNHKNTLPQAQRYFARIHRKFRYIVKWCKENFYNVYFKLNILAFKSF